MKIINAKKSIRDLFLLLTSIDLTPYADRIIKKTISGIENVIPVWCIRLTKGILSTAKSGTNPNAKIKQIIEKSNVILYLISEIFFLLIDPIRKNRIKMLTDGPI